jgi:thiosulfate dehydrogenase (quinone) large subunit
MPIVDHEQRNPDPAWKTFHADNLKLAYGLLRITLGIDIALHGVSRLLAGSASFVATLTKQFAGTPLPHFAVQGFGYTLPWLETTIGLLILFGALTRLALVAGALLIAVLMFGSSLNQDWSIVGIQLTYAVVYFILISLHGYNAFSLDAIFHNSQRASR